MYLSPVVSPQTSAGKIDIASFLVQSLIFVPPSFRSSMSRFSPVRTRTLNLIPTSQLGRQAIGFGLGHWIPNPYSGASHTSKIGTSHLKQDHVEFEYMTLEPQ